MPSELLTDRHGAVLVLTLRDPASRNSLSRQLVSAFAEALDIAESDPQVRCVLVHGAGADFCSGASAQADDEPSSFSSTSSLQAALGQLIESLRVFPKPVLAAVEGLAAGSGLRLALGCDLIVAAQDARFVLADPHDGGTTDDRSIAALTRLLPPPLLQQWAWLPEPMTAQQLHPLGIVGWLSDSGQALATALEVASRLAARSPQALAAAKERVQQASHLPAAPPPMPGPRQLPLGLEGHDQLS